MCWRLEYNINFCIISAAYLFITAVFYGRQGRMRRRRSALFAVMLQCGILSLLLDIAVAVLDPYAHLWPKWAVYGLNMLFLLCVQVSGLLFFFYSISLTGTYSRMSRRMRILSLLPFAAVTVLLLLSPVSQGLIFYLDENNVYHHGAAHIALYISTALYLIASLGIVFTRRKRLAPLKFYTIVAFLAATLIAMLIQAKHTYLLVNSTANAFALTLIYYILESPGAHVDALTRVFNRTALLPMLRDITDEGERFSLLMFSLNSLHIVNHSFGMKGGDEALMAFAAYLRRAYPKDSVLRIEGDIFCVLVRGGEYIDADSLAKLRKDTRGVFSIRAGRITLDTSLACINSEDCADAAEAAGVMDSLMQQHRTEGLGGMLLADGAFKARLKSRKAIELATRRALDEGRVEVHYQPIHEPSGRLCALEALVRISDPELGPLPTQELVELAERNGSIMRLGEQVIRTACAFIRDNDVAAWGLDHVGINLSAIQCIQGGLPDMIGRILEEYGLPDGLIAFEVTETAAGALSTERENMERLADRGISFLLDDFGTGYANFRNMASLPYRCIKLDKSLLWSAEKSASQMRLLLGVIKIVHALGLTSLCEGVETAEQAELLTTLGVAMLQGYYFSKPLPPEALLAYAGRGGS